VSRAGSVGGAGSVGDTRGARSAGAAGSTRSTRSAGGARRRLLGAVGRWVPLTIGVVIALLPFLWMLRTALGPSQSILGLSANPLPSSVSFHAFSQVNGDGSFTRAMITGIVVSVAIVALQLLTAIPAAYAFSWLTFRGRDALFAVVLATLLVPPQVIAVPNYVTVSALGLANTRVGLVVPFAASAVGIFLLRQYMRTIPPAVMEAARLDGLSTWRTIRSVVVPLSMPAIATVATFSFLMSFNEYLWPLLEARSPNIATPPLALARLNSAAGGVPDFAVLSAAALLISLPPLIVFALAQRRLVAGISGSGVDA
jgi:multiple sugar transport system permease protein